MLVDIFIDPAPDTLVISLALPGEKLTRLATVSSQMPSHLSPPSYLSLLLVSRQSNRQQQLKSVQLLTRRLLFLTSYYEFGQWAMFYLPLPVLDLLWTSRPILSCSNYEQNINAL